MDKKQLAIHQIQQQWVLPLYYHDDVSVCIAVAKTLYDAGIRCIEFTNRGKNAMDNFTALIIERDKSMPGLLLGIGTIQTAEEARYFVTAGADFLVSPFFDNAVCDIAYMNKMPWIPGCMTPTEIHAAQQAGSTIIKLFPGNLLGTGFVESVKSFFTNIDFVVTGGVEASEQSIAAWFNSGVAGVGIGGKLITGEILHTKNYDLLKEKTKELISIISNLRN